MNDYVGAGAAFVEGDIVTVDDFRRPPGKGCKSGSKVDGGIARITKAYTDAAVYDVNFYLEGRRAGGVPAAYVRTAHTSGSSVPGVDRAPMPLQSSLMTPGAGSDADGLVAPAISDRASAAAGKASEGADVMARAGTKRDRKPPVQWAAQAGLQLKRASCGSGTAGGGSGGSGGKTKAKDGGGAGGGGSAGAGGGSEADLGVARLPLMERNVKAFKQGKWRKEAFGLREYVLHTRGVGWCLDVAGGEWANKWPGYMPGSADLNWMGVLRQGGG